MSAAPVARKSSFKEAYSNLITHSISKLIVLIVFTTLTTFAIYACTQVEDDIQSKNFLRKDSESKKYL